MIGDKIKKLRENYGWTQNELAKKLGLTRSSVNAWEMGLSVPSTQYVVELANLFKVSTDYLLGLDSKILLDISDLANDEKTIVISLVDCFLKRKKT